MPDVTALPRPGDVFAGKYLIERVIGAGKNSLVFVAQHSVTGKRFAIEWMVPRAEHARHDAVIQDDEVTPAAVSGGDVRDATDFVSEAEDFVASEHQVVGHFRHPNVLEVYDVGEASGSLYTVKEWSEGESLEARLARTGAMSIPEASALLVPCMRGMHEAHAAGILHRDLKPSNIFLCQPTPSSPVVAKVLDFDVVLEPGRDADAASVVLWRGAQESKPYYRAPEQIGGLEVDHRADVYAFGAILYEVLTGRPPFAPVRYARRDERASHGVAALKSRSERLPPGADAIIGRAMARDVSRRFQSLKELADAFEALARSPLAFAPATLPGSPSFDPGAVRRVVTIPPPLAIEGNDAGTDPGAFTHEVSFTRNRPWPRPTRYEVSEEAAASERTRQEDASHYGLQRSGHVPEWSEPPSMHELQLDAEPPTRTDFFVETSFARERLRRGFRRYKPGYIASGVALAVALLALVIQNSNDAAPDAAVPPYYEEPIATFELEDTPAPPAHGLAQPPAQPAVQPPSHAQPPAAVSGDRPAAPSDPQASPRRQPTLEPERDVPARAARTPRANPLPAAKAPVRVRSKDAPPRQRAAVPAASDDPLAMDLM